LATIIQVEGSAYRKEGTSMLFKGDGTRIGLLSAGCNGIIRVLLEPVNSCLHKQLCKLKFYLDSGYRVTMIKKLTDEYSVTDYLFFVDDQHIFGKWQGEIPFHVRKLISEVPSEQKQRNINTLKRKEN
jgi:xanthine dehydrogenase accessory factor